eukprot:scaffold1152_cov235-Pinguiococcus_pyrenoidosus.AAC.3
MSDKLDVELQALVSRLDLLRQATGAADANTADPVAGLDDFSRAEFLLKQCISLMEQALPDVEQHDMESRSLEAVERNQQFQVRVSQSEAAWQLLAPRTAIGAEPKHLAEQRSQGESSVDGTGRAASERAGEEA